MLKIRRYSTWQDKIRKYKIVLDGNTLGKISDGETLEFPISNGKHELTLKIDWCRSQKLTFDKKDDDVEFECASNSQGLNIFLGILYVTFKYNEYISLKQIK